MCQNIIYKIKSSQALNQTNVIEMSLKINISKMPPIGYLLFSHVQWYGQSLNSVTVHTFYALYLVNH